MTLFRQFVEIRFFPFTWHGVGGNQTVLFFINAGSLKLRNLRNRSL
jgi:hypothetical protein